MMRFLVLALTVGMLHAAPVAQQRPTAEALAQALQQRYQGIRDFSADFVHTYRGGVIRRQLTERGTMAVKKPGRMRWNYTSPERKTFVSDGTKLYSYIPDDRQVIVTTMPSDDSATTPALFLTGKGNIARDFTASYADTTTPAAPALKLVPRRPETEYETLVVVLDPASLRITSLTTTDHQGGLSTFLFTNLKENRGLSDKEFAFRIPRGVDVRTDGIASR
jgi:outer membrane lipoprotein carrier protein